MTTSTFLGADLLVQALAANGFRVVAFNPGASEEIIASAFERNKGVVPVLAYQELTALGFAAGMALGGRASAIMSGDGGSTPARAAVVAHGLVGLGGMASFISGFAQQKLPVLILVGNAGVAEDSLGKHQNPNGGLEAMARGAGCRAVIWVTNPETLMHQLKRATMLAEGGTPGPVVLVIPQNGVMAAPVSRDTIIEKIPYLAHDTKPNPSAVRELAQRLSSARNPVILVGDEVARVGAVSAIVAVAEQSGARVIGSMAHELCFPMNHPLWSGSTGHVFGESARRLMADADCILSVGGVDISTVFPTADAPYSPSAWVTFVGSDAAAAASMYRGSSSPILASPKATAEQLAEELRKSETPDHAQQVAERAEKISSANQAARAARLAEADLERKKVALHAYDVATALKEVITELGLGQDVIIFNEGLTRALAIEDVLQPSESGRYFSSQGGSLGYAGPMASGIAYANPGKTVVAISGDGGFLYTPQWLLTAQENALDVKMIVFRDDAYSLLIQTAAAQGRPSPDTFELGIRRTKVKRQAPLDFVKLAAALGGAPAERVAARAELKEPLRRLLMHNGPALLEANTPMPT